MLDSCIALSQEQIFICNCGVERVADEAMEYSLELLDRGECASVLLLGTPRDALLQKWQKDLVRRTLRVPRKLVLCVCVLLSSTYCGFVSHLLCNALRTFFAG